MGYYQEVVVKPLEELANSGIGKLREISQERINNIYLFETGSNVFVTSVHHANEIYGTWQSVVQSLSSGIKIDAVPVVNTEGFDDMYKKIEDFKKIVCNNKGSIDNFLYESLAGGYKGEGRSQIIYPSWSKWNYGGTICKKQSSSLEIEKMVANSSIVIDIHNQSSDSYLLIVNETESRFQSDVEEIIKKVIRRNENKLDEMDHYGYSNLREGVYTNTSKIMSLTNFAGKLGLANIVLEVPSFTTDKKGHLVLLDQPRITDTNVEILSRIAEYANQFVKT